MFRVSILLNSKAMARLRSARPASARAAIHLCMAFSLRFHHRTASPRPQRALHRSTRLLYSDAVNCLQFKKEVTVFDCLIGYVLDRVFLLGWRVIFSAHQGFERMMILQPCEAFMLVARILVFVPQVALVDLKKGCRPCDEGLPARATGALRR